MGVQILCQGIPTYYATQEALCEISGPQFDTSDITQSKHFVLDTAIM